MDRQIIRQLVPRRRLLLLISSLRTAVREMAVSSIDIKNENKQTS